VNEHSSITGLGFFEEVNNSVEAALNVLEHMVLQVEGQVVDAFTFVIVGRVVASTVDDMSDAVLLQLLEVLGNVVTTEVNEEVLAVFSLNDRRADVVELQILVLLATGAFVVEFLVDLSLHVCVIIGWDHDAGFTALSIEFASTAQGWRTTFLSAADRKLQAGRLLNTAQVESEASLFLIRLIFDVLDRIILHCFLLGE
jgi:hypothetical protein